MVSPQQCGFCGRDFAPDHGQPACASCPLRGGCSLVRCPHCGWENPVAPAWLERVRSWLHRLPQHAAGDSMRD